ncbi:MAG: hypothetical protein MJ107_00360 [Lachnospiraceae bacterium]|nr:hypothetical protein [Lachnospiraceae bacterium]
MKSFRKFIADKIGVNLHQTECTYEGECQGTCPKCKKEEEVLNKALLTKGAVAAATLATTVTLAGCGPADLFNKFNIGPSTSIEDLGGATELAPIAGDMTDPIEELEGEVAAPISDEDPIIEELEGDVAMPISDEDPCIEELEGDVAAPVSEDELFVEGMLEVAPTEDDKNNPDEEYIEEGEVADPVSESSFNNQEALARITVVSR